MRQVKATFMVVLYTIAFFSFFIGVLSLLDASSLHGDVNRDYVEYLEAISQGVIAISCFLVTTILTLWATAILQQDNWNISHKDEERTRRGIELMMMAQNKKRRERPKE